MIFHVEALMIKWALAEETQLNPNELQNKLLLATEMYGHNVWKRAAEQGNLKALGSLLSLVKEAQLNTDEFLQAETGDEYTVFQLAAGNNRLETVLH